MDNTANRNNTPIKPSLVPNGAKTDADRLAGGKRDGEPPLLPQIEKYPCDKNSNQKTEGEDVNMTNLENKKPIIQIASKNENNGGVGVK